MKYKTREELVESLKDMEKHHDIGHWLLEATDIVQKFPSDLQADLFTRKMLKIVNECCSDLEALVIPFQKKVA